MKKPDCARIRLELHPDQVARMDRARGSASRPKFIRNAISRLCGDYEQFGEVILYDIPARRTKDAP